MSDVPSDDVLRQAASNRGFKLAKSRRRKPGVGDYGLFGLSDANGKPLLGFGESGFTATASEVADYLRKGEQSTWAESARVTPAKSRSGKTSKPAAGAAPTDEAKSLRRKAAPEREGDRDVPSSDAKSRRVAGTSGKMDAALRDTEKSPPKHEPIDQPAPELSIRAASADDATAIADLAKLLGDGIDASGTATLIRDFARTEHAVLVAERGGIVGFLVWQQLRTLQGSIGRVIALVVDEGSRRSGIGRELLDTAVRAMEKEGCTGVEAISDIDVRNAHGFFRRADFEQTSYRFLRPMK
jgi:ribosomal protein S18 acetylase RimI-like enzyme